MQLEQTINALAENAATNIAVSVVFRRMAHKETHLPVANADLENAGQYAYEAGVAIAAINHLKGVSPE